MSKLYLLNYKNYYNRDTKSLNSIADYTQYKVCDPITANFNPNDGVDTEHVIGTGTFNHSPDYLVVTDTVDSIVSRWYVMDSTRTRNGQFRMILHRDLFADYKGAILNAPAMIRKGYLNLNNPLIFNPEGNTYNQIKQSIEHLKDATDCGWVCLYHSVLNQPITTTIPIPGIKIDGIYTTANPYPFDAYCKKVGTSGTVEPSDRAISRYRNASTGINIKFSSGAWRELMWLNGTQIDTDDVTIPWGQPYITSNNEPDTKSKLLGPLYNIRAQFENLATLSVNSTYTAMLDEVGKNYQINGVVYNVRRVIETSDLHKTKYFNTEDEWIITNDMATLVNTVLPNTITPPSDIRDGLFIYGKRDYATLELVEVPQSYIPVTIPTSVRKLNDAPYCMCCMPYGEFMNVNGSPIYVSQTFAIDAMTTVGTNVGEGKFDIQILPYCPRRDYLTGTIHKSINAGNGYGVENSDYVILTDNSSNVRGAIVWCAVSQFEFNINKSITVPTDDIEFKVDNETSFYRLVSPNYNGTYQFNSTMNYGVDGFNVYCSYKPFNPYIQLKPMFKGMYGYNHKDERGLICSGDFSIAQISDEWINYQLNNKNYQNSFDRQVETQEYLNDIQAKHDIVSAITGTVSGGTSGAMTGAMAGGVYGAVAGAVIGGVGSAVGGVMDVTENKEIREKQLQLQKDQFNMNNQNIAARAQSITKVSSQTPVFQIFPFIEHWDTTDTEKALLRSKLTYRGMTVNAIGTIQQYTDNNNRFVQGSFIKLELPHDDTHLLQSINNELEQGVYI